MLKRNIKIRLNRTERYYKETQEVEIYKFERIVDIGCRNFSVINKRHAKRMKFMRMKFAGKSICLTLTIKQGLEAKGFSFHLCQIYFMPFKFIMK